MEVIEYKGWKLPGELAEDKVKLAKSRIDDWGCPYDPRDYAGQPLGMYHCEGCGHMVLAGATHAKIDPITLELIDP